MMEILRLRLKRSKKLRHNSDPICRIWIEKIKVTEVQRYKRSKIQKIKDTKDQRYRKSKTQKIKDTNDQIYKRSKKLRHKDTIYWI